jgi:hypothetical protein
MLAAMRHNSNEVLMIIDNITFNHRICTSNDIRHVDIPDYMIDILNSNINTTFTMIHNHPSNNGFSISDLRTFIQKDKISYLFICTNDCSTIAAIGKNNIDLITKNRMIHIINEYMIENKCNKHSSALKLIQYFVQKELIYIVYKNY